MNKKIIILIFLTINSVNFIAAQRESSLQQANEFYEKGKYAQAEEIYQNILKTNETAPELYYNLGNACFKQDKLAHAILNYERALRLATNYADARHNLAFAQQKVIDNIPDSNSFFLINWIKAVINLLNSNNWFYLSFVLFVLTLVFVFFFIFGKKHFLRKTSFYIAFLCLIISVITLVFSGIQKKYLLTRNAAIVMNGAVTVKSSPDKSGTDLFVLHEGAKVLVVGVLNSWVEIRLANGNAGWVEEQTIERI
ncbi:MAG: tetratricopeptide repeat protein [Paludibacter sp.]|nr:tetratricopeptide repeat protein [Paludibacter sp.]